MDKKLTVQEHLTSCPEFSAILRHASESVQVERFFCNYPPGETALDRLQQDTFEALLAYFKGELQNPDYTFTDIGYRACAAGTPATNISVAFFAARDELTSHCFARGNGEEAWSVFTKAFGKIRVALSRGYLRRDIEMFTRQLSAEFEQDDLFSTHALWVKDVASAIIAEDVSLMPELDATRCDMAEWLASRETILILPDEMQRKDIHALHEDIHSLASNISFILPSRDFYQISELFRELGRKSLHLLHLLNNVYKAFRLNRTNRFMEYVCAQVSSGEAMLVAVVNVRKLGITNRIFGEHAGNRLLSDVERTIRNYSVSISPYPFVVQGHGGEFFICFEDALPEEAERFCTRLMTRLHDIAATNDIDAVTSRVSIALTKVTPDVGIRPDTLERILGYAINRAKNEGDGFMICSDAFREELLRDVEGKKETVRFVQSAIQDDLIESFFQPVIRLSDNTLFDVEALARIRRNGAFIPAGAFIDVIYELDAVVALDLLMTDHIAKYAAQLSGITEHIFINVSPLTLSSRAWHEKIRSTVSFMRECGITPLFELTEQAFLNNLNLVQHLHKNDGIEFAVDDFGSGYSSLKLVADLSDLGAIRYLKIDGSLTKGLTTKSGFQMFSSICHLAKHLHLSTIAEYIDSDHLLGLAKEAGAVYGQGYHFSQPVQAAEIVQKYPRRELA